MKKKIYLMTLALVLALCPGCGQKEGNIEKTAKKANVQEEKKQVEKEAISEKTENKVEEEAAEQIEEDKEIIEETEELDEEDTEIKENTPEEKNNQVYYFDTTDKVVEVKENKGYDLKKKKDITIKDPHYG